MIKGIHHISMKCGNDEEFSRVREFYISLLGLSVCREWADGIMIDTGNGYIEVFTNAEGEKRPGAIRHVALLTDDVDEITDKVKAAGYEVFVEPTDKVIESEPLYRIRMAFCFGPLGEQVEFFCEKQPATTLETERLILRRWKDSDAEDLYQYARDPDVGPIAGWPPHQSVNESRDVIRNVFSGKEAYAVCLKSDGRAIGAIELKLYGSRGNDLATGDGECEMGYWLGKPFWGRGIMPEAAKEMLRHAFEDLGMSKVWAGYYEGNTKSKRVQEKAGFRYQWKSEGVEVPLMHETRNGYVSSITKDQWQKDRT